MVSTEDYIFKTGFTYKGIPYGLYQNVLCRLPYNNLSRYHSIKRVTFKDGLYRLGGCRKSKKQVDKMIKDINYTYTHFVNNTPF
jgi:hypothetical protein